MLNEILITAFTIVASTFCAYYFSKEVMISAVRADWTSFTVFTVVLAVSVFVLVQLPRAPFWLLVGTTASIISVLNDFFYLFEKEKDK